MNMVHSEEENADIKKAIITVVIDSGVTSMPLNDFTLYRPMLYEDEIQIFCSLRNDVDSRNRIADNPYRQRIEYYDFNGNILE